MSDRGLDQQLQAKDRTMMETWNRSCESLSAMRSTGARPGGIKFLPASEFRDATNTSWWGGFIAGALVGGAISIAVVLSVHAANAQSPAPLPTSYSFTFTPEATDALYAALERANQVQALTTGERSPRFEALEAQLRQGVADQKAAAMKAAVDAAKPKEDAPKAEAPKP